MTTGQRIKDMRKRVGITQAELAEKLGVPYQSVSQWERDTRNPKIETLQRIADALGIHILDLMGVGQALDKYVYEITDIKPNSENPEDLTPEKITQVVESLSRGVREVYDTLDDEDKAKFWKIAAQPLHAELADAFNALNSKGQEIAVERVQELTEIPRYRRQEAPQPPPASVEGKDTTPAEPPPESPPEGG